MSLMEITENQKSQIKAWLDKGESLSDIQDLMRSELDINLTYMDLRFLIDDLNLELKKEEEPENSDPKATPEDMVAEELEPVGVSVSVDPVTRPGTVVSGSVTFSDGQKSGWYLDQMGRLGLIPSQEGYKPSPEDLQEFQRALQDELHRAGF